MPPAVTRAEKRFYDFDGFRVDPVRRRLSRDNEVVAITPKAFSILLILIENRGEVVEKEDIIQKVWPDTFVTEANLTQNVSSLRKALGERANDARYIVTVPGRGYSFVADVEETPRDATGEISLAMLPPAEELVLAEDPKPDWALPGRPAPVAPPPPPSIPGNLDPLETVQIFPSQGVDHEDTGIVVTEPIKKQAWLWAAGAVVLLILIGIGVTLLGRPQPPAAEPVAAPKPEDPALPAPPPRPAVAVLTIRNESGNEALSWVGSAVIELLTTDMSTSPRLRVVSGDNVTEARQSPALAQLENLSPEQLTQLHNLVRADFVIFGSFEERSGDRLRLRLRALKLPQGGISTPVSDEGRRDELFDLVSRASAKLREEMGWGTRSAEEVKASRALWMSPAASRLYFEGLERLRRFDARGASERLEKAAAADRSSPLIRSALSQAWLDLGYSQRAAAAAEEAVRLSRPLPETERLLVGARYYEARNRWDQAGAVYRKLWKRYPDDLEYGLRLVRSLTEAGHGAEARQAVAELHRLPAPARQDPRIDVAEARVAKRMADYNGAFRAAATAAEKGRRLHEQQVLAQALLLQGDALIFAGRPQQARLPYEEAARLFRQAGNQGAVALVLTHQGVALHEQGDLAGAQKLYEEALTIGEELGNESLMAVQLANLGLLRQDLGELAEARQLLEQSLQFYRRVGDRVLEGRTLNFLGTVLASMDEFSAARQCFEQAVAVSRTTGNRTDEARSLDNLGSILERQGSLTAARQFREQALEIAGRLSDPTRAADIKASLASTLAHLGELDRADQLLAEAQAASEQAKGRVGSAQILGLRSEIALQRGDLQAARQAATEQLALARQAGARLACADAARNLARCEAAAGNFGRARKLFEESLRTNTELGEEVQAVRLRLDLAHLALAEGKPAEAAAQAQGVAQRCQRSGAPSCRAEALAVLSQALTLQGRRLDGRRTADLARLAARNTEDRWIQGFVRASTATAESAIPAPAGDRPGRSAR